MSCCEEEEVVEVVEEEAVEEEEVEEVEGVSFRFFLLEELRHRLCFSILSSPLLLFQHAHAHSDRSRRDPRVEGVSWSIEAKESCRSGEERKKGHGINQNAAAIQSMFNFFRSSLSLPCLPLRARTLSSRAMAAKRKLARSREPLHEERARACASSSEKIR